MRCSQVFVELVIKICYTFCMKHLVIFLVALLLCLLSMQHMHFFKKTKKGERYEYFKTETSKVLPQILTGYLNESGIRYTVYKIPNYVMDLFTYNKDFNIITKSKPKYTVILFPYYKSEAQNAGNLSSFNTKVKNMVEVYRKDFNMIVRDDIVKPRYIQRSERDAYENLEVYCGNFCLIDPSQEVMFVFKNITMSETTALDAVFQHYSLKNHDDFF